MNSQQKTYSHERFNQLTNETITKINRLGALKGGEYAGDDDRLANFRRNGIQLDLPMETVWSIYYNKHHDAVMQYIKDQRTGKVRERMEGIDGRIDDMILYLILLKAMVDERENAAKPVPTTSKNERNGMYASAVAINPFRGTPQGLAITDPDYKA